MRTCSIAVVCLCVSASISAAPYRTERNKVEGVEGSWRWVSFEWRSSGFFRKGSFEYEEGKKPLEKWTFDGGKLSIEGWTDKRKASYSLPPQRLPNEIDITYLDGVHQGRTFPAIFSRQGDRLVICMRTQPGGVRPTEFSTEKGRELKGDDGLTLLVFDRQR
jgi:uncharacterized protein (TIGR03067 family)